MQTRIIYSGLLTHAIRIQLQNFLVKHDTFQNRSNIKLLLHKSCSQQRNYVIHGSRSRSTFPPHSITSSSYLPIEWNRKYRHLSLLKVRRTITDMPPMPALTLPNAVQNFIVESYSVMWAKVTSIHYTIKVAGNEAGCVCIVNYLPKLYS